MTHLRRQNNMERKEISGCQGLGDVGMANYKAGVWTEMWDGQTFGTEPLTCGICYYLQVDGVRT